MTWKDGRGGTSAGQLAQEFALVHVVLEGLAAVNEDHRDLVGELPPQLLVRIDIHFLPAEQAPALELHQALLDDLAEMAPLPGVNEDFAGGVHEAECSRFEAIFNPEKL